MSRVIRSLAIVGLVFGLSSAAKADFLYNVQGFAFDVVNSLPAGGTVALDSSTASSPASVTHNSITYSFDSGRTAPTFNVPLGHSLAISVTAYERNFNPGPGGNGWDSFSTPIENLGVDWVFPSVNNSGATDSLSTNLSPFTIGYGFNPSVSLPIGTHHGFIAVYHTAAFNNPLYTNLASPFGTSNGILGADYTQTSNFPVTVIVGGPVVPEPSSILVWAGLGLSVLGARWYRRRKATA